MEKKKEISSEDLCFGFLNEFFKYVDYTKNLKYEEIPDYDMLKNLFLDVIQKRKEKMDYIYDWTTNEDLLKRKETTKNEDEKQTNKEKNNKDEDFNSNTNNKQLKKEGSQNDKVESVCCIMYVYKIYNFY